jgi:2-phosphosulfolactate phosphatase
MSSRILNVHYLPQQVTKQELVGSAVVVIDLLRASTTICQAIASGAAEVVPFLEVDETLAAAAAAGRHNIILGGERYGKRIPGFDLGNSPTEYTPRAVGGRRVFITTTNGTRALQHARLARRILVGAMVNLSAVAQSLRDEPCVDILCAGTDDDFTQEDILAAGALVYELSTVSWQINENADNARLKWIELVARARAARRTSSEQLALELVDTQGGRNLVRIGLGADLAECAHIDRLAVLPELDVPSWRIRAN